MSLNTWWKWFLFRNFSVNFFKVFFCIQKEYKPRNTELYVLCWCYPIHQSRRIGERVPSSHFYSSMFCFFFCVCISSCSVSFPWERSPSIFLRWLNKKERNNTTQCQTLIEDVKRITSRLTIVSSLWNSMSIITKKIASRDTQSLKITHAFFYYTYHFFWGWHSIGLLILCFLVDCFVCFFSCLFVQWFCWHHISCVPNQLTGAYYKKIIIMQLNRSQKCVFLLLLFHKFLCFYNSWYIWIRTVLYIFVTETCFSTKNKNPNAIRFYTWIQIHMINI